MAVEGKDPAPRKEPIYLLSLEVANVRCFGPRQTLDLTDGQGRPARWTVLLGDNGSGKSTLLQCLAGLVKVGGGEAKVWAEALDRIWDLFLGTHSPGMWRGEGKKFRPVRLGTNGCEAAWECSLGLMEVRD